MATPANIVILAYLCCFAWLHLNFCACEEFTKPQCIASEGETLLQFKQNLTDPLNRLQSWSVNKDCCTWEGVVCNNITGHVLELHLRSSRPFFQLLSSSYYEQERAYKRSRFGGDVSPSLLDLKHLNHLDLSGNDFGGMSIPSFIGSLKSLIYLNLSRAGFGGKIPHQLGNLSNLLYLDLKTTHDTTKLSGKIPSEIGNLTNLIHLNLGKDEIIFQYGGVYSYWENDLLLYVENLEWLSSLSSLEYLDLSYTNLSKVFDWSWVVYKLPTLKELYLINCPLHYYNRPSTNNFSSLVTLDLSQTNYFQAPFIPNWIFGLRKLISLKLHVNYFQGPIPDNIQNFTMLENLDLSLNLFNSSIPNWLYNLSHLKSINIFRNNLHGTISSDIAKLTSILSLDLRHNQLEGKVPTSLGYLCNLREIYLSFEKFNQNISEVLEILSGCASFQLETLWVSDSPLSNHLTDQIGVFANLVHLSLFTIQGVIPRSLEKLSSLQYLDIENNQFQGNPFDIVGKLSKLQILGVGSNHFQGVVAEIHIANLTSLTILYAPENQLTLMVNFIWSPPFQLCLLDLSSWQLGSKFPTWIQSQKYLQVLCISNTRISGTITNFLCRKQDEPTYLEFLILRSDNFSGKIPDCWMMWQNLVTVILQNNSFTGYIPTSIGSLPGLKHLELGNNKLSGKFPLLQNSTQLISLGLEKNQIAGTIPSWIGEKLVNLKILRLGSNKYFGQIPPEICTLKFLQVLDLAENNLIGHIPKCFHHLKAMTTTNSADLRLICKGKSGTIYTQINATLRIKGVEREYNTILGLIKSVDLSSNKLSGNIPTEITSLLGLLSLNLSKNLLSGEIPQTIGNMRTLESLDLSWNQLVGAIPPSLANLTFLNKLNLSYNHLKGKIPTGTQLQSLEQSSFKNNSFCGPPLLNICSTQLVVPEVDNNYEGNEHGIVWFFVSIAFGFIVGFWGFVGPLFLYRSWRQAYFQWIDNMWHKVRYCW